MGKVTDAQVIDESSYNQTFALYLLLIHLLCYQENHPDSWREGKQGLVAVITLFIIQVASSVYHHVVVLFSP